MIRFAALLLLAAIAAPLAARSGEPAPLDQRSFTCPVGGKKFTQDVGYSAFPLITLPDGSWLGDAQIDVQIPACPDNGLVILPDYAAMAAGDEQRMIYSDYSAAERAQLPALIADPAYRALRSDNRHAQAYWLATKLGRPGATRFALLQRSTWATIDPAIRKRRVAQFAADGPALIDTLDEPADTKRFQRVYIVNALRELARFNEALALLEANEAGGAPVPGQPDPDSIYGPEPVADRMRTAIAARDDDRFPIDLLDQRTADAICSGEAAVPPYDQRTPKTDAACARLRAAANARQAALDEAMALGDDPEQRDRLCAATPADKRTAALAQACEFAQNDRDQAAGDALAMQGRAAAARCQATPENERAGPLFYACIGYDILVESRLGRMLVEEDAAYAVLCGNDGARDYPDRDRHVSLACYTASSERMDRDVAALSADGAALDARCPGDEETDIALAIACSQRQKARQTAHIEKLATDDAAYKLECARLGDKPRDLFADDASEAEVDCDQARYRRAHAKDENDDWPPLASVEGREVIDVEGGEPHGDRTADAIAAVQAATAAAMENGPSYLTEGSELDLAARDAAAAIVDRAKAENTYPRRPKGQLD